MELCGKNLNESTTLTLGSHGNMPDIIIIYVPITIVKGKHEGTPTYTFTFLTDYFQNLHDDNMQVALLYLCILHPWVQTNLNKNIVFKMYITTRLAFILFPKQS